MLTHPTALREQDAPAVHANSDLAAGLRDLADFLDAHPELPRARFATVSLRAAEERTYLARGTLQRVARALGDRAVESRRHRPGACPLVDITGRFGPVKLIASASIDELRDVDGSEPEPITAGYRDPMAAMEAALDEAIREMGLDRRAA